jgi:peptidoglycan/LPS O-acetylase OafA/YrhL
MNSIKLSDLTSGRNNNLDAIRLFAALMVVFGHCFRVPPNVFITSGTIGEFGVLIFFFISGFLITQSYENINNPVRFLWARFLRIFPALIIVVLVSVFILGAVMTTLPLKEYFTNSQTYSYLSYINLYDMKLYLPGVFDGGIVNSPLWTLRYEFTCYFIILILGMSRLLKRKYIVLGLVASVIAVTFFSLGDSTNVLNIHFYTMARFFAYFGIGVVAYLFRRYIPLRIDLLLITAVAIIVPSFWGGIPIALFSIPLGYLILFIGYSPRVNLRSLTKYGDYSYGIYILHWPVQRVLTNATPDINPFLLFALSGVITYALAGLSWHLIEKRALMLKNRKIRISTVQVLFAPTK